MEIIGSKTISAEELIKHRHSRHYMNLWVENNTDPWWENPGLRKPVFILRLFNEGFKVPKDVLWEMCVKKPSIALEYHKIAEVFDRKDIEKLFPKAKMLAFNYWSKWVYELGLLDKYAINSKIPSYLRIAENAYNKDLLLDGDYRQYLEQETFNYSIDKDIWWLWHIRFLSKEQMVRAMRECRLECNEIINIAKDSKVDFSVFTDDIWNRIESMKKYENSWLYLILHSHADIISYIPDTWLSRAKEGLQKRLDVYEKGGHASLENNFWTDYHSPKITFDKEKFAAIIAELDQETERRNHDVR